MDLIAALQAQARRFTSVGHTDGSTGDVYVRSLSSVEVLDGTNKVCISDIFQSIFPSGVTLLHIFYNA